MSFRFLHSSDLHLGKPFGNFPEGIRGRLREARHQSIERLAQAAREGGASHVLLAGDTFDAETPAPDTLRQALNSMGQATDLAWVLMPGNHDSLAATELWRRISSEGPPNVTLALEPESIDLTPQVMLLPAPCTQRRPGRDLTDWMDGEASEGKIRIGLAHGAITDFTGEEDVPGVIPPDRASRSGLDYLALGDWHGAMTVGDRTCYSGTPERDRFKHQGSAVALLIEVSTPGAPPQITEIPTGIFDWRIVGLDLLPGEDAARRLSELLPDPAHRRDALIRIDARGRLCLPGREVLKRAISKAQPDFGWMSVDLDTLATEASAGDLDLIDRAGALRAAAEALLSESEDLSLAETDRSIAAVALSRLYGYAAEDRS